jgi:uncharacterized protein (DUF1800 family)
VGDGLRHRYLVIGWLVAAVFLAAGCSSSDSGGDTPAGGGAPVVPSVTPIGDNDVHRFLTQATFGATTTEMARLKSLGDASTAYARWIDQQLVAGPSLILPGLKAALAADPGLSSSTSGQQALIRDAWFLHAMTAPDQLRQRVAFALSEILVVSSEGSGLTTGLADYYDTLARNAFGDYRRLLEEVTLHPAMGVYLSMLGNRKADAAGNVRPDENYAREVMQLFSIGLVQLEPDGTVRRDADGVPLPTYDQSVIEGFARVFTGWTYAGAPSFRQARATVENQAMPMQAYPEEHSSEEKRLLAYPGATKTVLPSGQTPQQDLADALDNIFHHPNVGPFISRQLIQRLVTSNPSPAYVRRVTAKFDDDGTGRRGNLGAVVRAILLDPEARPTQPGPATGKVKEPLLRVTQLWRAYDAKAANGRYRLRANYEIGQMPLRSPSVFNYFRPDFSPPGELAQAGLAAPELQLATEFLSASVSNAVGDLTLWWNTAGQRLPEDAVLLDIASELAVADQPAALVDLVAAKLLGGRISPSLRASVEAAVAATPSTNRAQRAADAIFLVASSPEFAVQR